MGQRVGGFLPLGWTLGRGATGEVKLPLSHLSGRAVKSHTQPPTGPPQGRGTLRMRMQILQSTCTLTATHTHTMPISCHARSSLSHTHTGTDDSLLQATTTSFPPSRSLNVRSCPQALNFFRGGARDRRARITRPGGLGRAVPRSGLPHAPHLVNRGTAGGCSRPRARSPSRRPSRGTRTASCWRRGGRACAP